MSSILTVIATWYTKRRLKKYMISKLKQWALRKVKASFGSTTMAVAAATVSVGVWIQQNPDLISALVPENYEGVSIAALGLIVAIARMRTVDKGK
jgi:hypothetical protein